MQRKQTVWLKNNSLIMYPSYNAKMLYYSVTQPPVEFDVTKILSESYGVSDEVESFAQQVCTYIKQNYKRSPDAQYIFTKDIPEKIKSCCDRIQMLKGTAVFEGIIYSFYFLILNINSQFNHLN